MKRVQVGYFFSEGIRGIFLHGFMSFAAVGVIAACLLITGSVALLAMNVDAVITDVQSQNEILVIIEDNLSEAEAKSVGSAISLVDNVSEREFVSKDQALEEYEKQLGENGGIIAGLPENPLRHRFIVRVADVSQIRATIAELKKLPGVAEVNAQAEISDFIMGLRRIVNAVSVSLVVMLLFVSVFIVSNTVKLATYDRREEIAIMRVVGATNAFIRWPFVIEGFLLGITGAALAFFAEWALYRYLFTQLSGSLPIVSVIPFGDIFLLVAGAFLLFGFVSGIAGSTLTIRRFLKV